MVCSNAAVDPHDRNRLIFAHSGDWRVWESTDGAATAAELPNATHSAFYVMIDSGGWYRAAERANPEGGARPRRGPPRSSDPAATHAGTTRRRRAAPS